jgi:hypothetical protein
MRRISEVVMVLVFLVGIAVGYAAAAHRLHPVPDGGAAAWPKLIEVAPESTTSQFRLLHPAVASVAVD